MKKLYIYPLSLAFACLAFAACTSDDDEMAPGAWNAAADYANVAFEALDNSVELDPADATDGFIKVTRQNTKGAVTVPVNIVTNTDDVFTVDPLTFADGEAEANLTFHFPTAEVGKPYTLAVEITDPNFVSEYSAVSTYSYTVTRVKWNDVSYIMYNGEKIVGYAEFTDDINTSGYGIDNLTFPTRLQERADKPGYFRMINTYDNNFDYTYYGYCTFDTSKDYYIYIDATDPEKVYIPENCNIGLNWGYGTAHVWSLVGYGIANDRQDLIDGNYGTYKNGVITFPKGALLFGEEGYNDGAFYPANGSGLFKLVVDPDKNLYNANPYTDFTFENVFLGSLNSSLLKAKRDAMFQVGTCTNETDDCGTRFEEEYGKLYRLQSPYVDGYDLLFAIDEKGVVSVPTGLEKQLTGLVSINKKVYAAINGGASSYNEAESLLKLTIEFFDEAGLSLGEFEEELSYKPTWNVVGTGTYTYTAWYDEPYEEEDLTFSKRPDKEGIYRIDAWFAGEPLEFTWDATTNEVTVPFQSTGFEEEEEEIFVADIATWFNNPGYPASYFDPETNTFNIYMIYGTETDALAGNWETFEVEFTNGGSVKAKVRAKSIPALKGTKMQNKTARNPLARIVPQKKDIKKLRSDMTSFKIFK